MRLEDARKQKRMTQEDVIEKLDLSLRHYQNIERGRAYPTILLALEICRLFELDPRSVDEWKGSYVSVRRMK